MIKIEKKILDIIRDKNIKEYKYEVVMPWFSKRIEFYKVIYLNK